VKKSPQTGRDPNPASAKWHLTRREVEVLDLLRTGAFDRAVRDAFIFDIREDKTDPT
jgi:DNA-binding NarL/FixJ family response regulator